MKEGFSIKRANIHYRAKELQLYMSMYFDDIKVKPYYYLNAETTGLLVQLPGLEIKGIYEKQYRRCHSLNGYKKYIVGRRFGTKTIIMED